MDQQAEFLELHPAASATRGNQIFNPSINKGALSIRSYRMNPQNKLKRVIGFATFLFIIHGIEEYIAGFYKLDPLFIFLSQTISSLSLSTTFLIFQVLFWLLLIYLFISIKKEKALLWVTILFGLLAIFELEHIVKAIAIRQYYSGAITALTFPSIIVFSVFAFLCIRCCKDYCKKCSCKKPKKAKPIKRRK